MNKEFVTYEIALALKGLGFNEECMAHCMGYGKGEIENGTYKIEHTQIFYPNDWITSDDVAEKLNLHCFHMCKIPLKQQVFRWFREKYNQNSFIELVYQDRIKYDYVLYVNKKEEECENYGDGPFITYEEAENACIDKLIEIVKQQEK
jgi:hypothetical protein